MRCRLRHSQCPDPEQLCLDYSFSRTNICAEHSNPKSYPESTELEPSVEKVTELNDNGRQVLPLNPMDPQEETLPDSSLPYKPIVTTQNGNREYRISGAVETPEEWRRRKERELNDLEAKRVFYISALRAARGEEKHDPLRLVRKELQIIEWEERNSLRKWIADRDGTPAREKPMHPLQASKRQWKTEERHFKESFREATFAMECSGSGDEQLDVVMSKLVSLVRKAEMDVETCFREALYCVDKMRSIADGQKEFSVGVRTDSWDIVEIMNLQVKFRIDEHLRAEGIQPSRQGIEEKARNKERHGQETKDRTEWIRSEKSRRKTSLPRWKWFVVYQQSSLAREVDVDTPSLTTRFCTLWKKIRPRVREEASQSIARRSYRREGGKPTR